MELRHLRYFLGVAESLNFTRAAEKLRIAQPALSRQISDLEAEMGIRLFDRSTKGVRLTEPGAYFRGKSARSSNSSTARSSGPSGSQGGCR